MRVDKIYFDMDGVLADFNRGVAELCGIAPPLKQDEDPVEDEIMWAHVKEVPHFYDKLELMPGAKEMFDLLYKKYGDKCEILTGIPNERRGLKDVAEDKIKWMRRLLSEDIVINTVRKANKKDYVKGGGYILIDDLEPTVETWNALGGTGILHTSAAETLEILKKLGII